MRDLPDEIYPEAQRREVLFKRLPAVGLSTTVCRAITDRLTLTRAFEASGIQSEAAQSK